jgi:hypothetical protein
MARLDQSLGRRKLHPMLPQFRPSAAYTVSTETDRYIVTLFQKDGEDHYCYGEYCGTQNTGVRRLGLPGDMANDTANQKSHAVFVECLRAIRDVGGEITAIYPTAIAS